MALCGKVALLLHQIKAALVHVEHIGTYTQLQAAELVLLFGGDVGVQPGQAQGVDGVGAEANFLHLLGKRLVGQRVGNVLLRQAAEVFILRGNVFSQAFLVEVVGLFHCQPLGSDVITPHFLAGFDEVFFVFLGLRFAGWLAGEFAGLGIWRTGPRD